jgi:hypothetical protein
MTLMLDLQMTANVQAGQTSDASDHPRRVFLSWTTRAEGYQLLPVEAAP